jgi:biopolymer transport protein ExbB
LFTIPVNTDNILERIRYLIEKKEIDEIHNLFDKQKRTPAVQLAKTALKYRDADRSVMENAIEETALGQMPRLERFLTTLSVLAAVAPLLGLLGTVTGMIHTFEGITLFGTGDPRMMSGGISEALITTQLGLAVAIPVIIAHHIFDRRVEKMMGDMDEKGTALVNLFSEKTRRKTA